MDTGSGQGRHDLSFRRSDYGDEWIQVGASVPVVFTLSVDPDIVDVVNFSFEVVVQGVS